MKKWFGKLVPKWLKALWYANKENAALNKKNMGCTFENENCPGEAVHKPANIIPVTLSESVIVKQGETSPVDMIAFRIAQKILADGLCETTRTEIAGGYVRYTVKVKIGN